MTPEEKQAYEWALNQKFNSVAARYARVLAQYIERTMQANNTHELLAACKVARDGLLAFGLVTISNDLHLNLQVAEAMKHLEGIGTRLDSAIATAVEGVACIWKYDGWDDAYATDCGNIFLLIEGNLSDNDFHFCTFCGRPIKEEKEGIETRLDAAIAVAELEET